MTPNSVAREICSEDGGGSVAAATATATAAAAVLGPEPEHSICLAGTISRLGSLDGSVAVASVQGEQQEVVVSSSANENLVPSRPRSSPIPTYRDIAKQKQAESAMNGEKAAADSVPAPQNREGISVPATLQPKGKLDSSSSENNASPEPVADGADGVPVPTPKPTLASSDAPALTGSFNASSDGEGAYQQGSDHSGLEFIASVAQSANAGTQHSGIEPSPPPITNEPSRSIPSTIEVTTRRLDAKAKRGAAGTSTTVLHADVVSSVAASPPPSRGNSGSLRRGKWSVEEEAYCARVIQDFNSGYLDAPAGTTLRSYLSEKLYCDPMRITKKFTGDACIGKRVFHPAVRCPSNAAEIDKAQAELDALELRWRRRLEMQQRESAKKAAASAAAAAAHGTGRGTYLEQATANNPLATGQQPVVIDKKIAVARTASWLDRANTILSGQQQATSTTTGQDHAQAVQSLPPQEIENQMEAVQRLIHEGPSIRQSTVALPNMLDDHGSSVRTAGDQSLPNSPSRPPVDKRPRRLNSSDDSGAEDAEALVGFLNSVRAHASAAVTTSQPGAGDPN